MITENQSKLKVGDKVRYSNSFLRSISAYAGSLPFAKGRITSITDFGSTKIAMIRWNDPEVPAKVNVANLEKVR